MSGKRRTKANKQAEKTKCCEKSYSYTKEELVEIQAEAYYKALKRVEEEKLEQQKKTVENKKKVSFLRKLLLVLNVLFWPWKMHKSFKMRDQIYDSVLVLFVSEILCIIGFTLWISGFIIIGYAFYCIVKNGVAVKYFDLLPIVIFSWFIGSILILSGKAFGRETDSNKIYAYSASIIAMISCIIALIALILQLK